MHEVERLLKQAYKSCHRDALLSPPDVFAICAYFARITGCYLVYSNATERTRTAVAESIEDGKAWRGVLDENASPSWVLLPDRIVGAWNYIAQNISFPIEKLRNDKVFVTCVLRLIVATDQACEGVGIPGSPSRGSFFEFISEIRIHSGTLCCYVPSESLRVLPKQHTPQSGFNIRSLTHHLALCTASEVLPIWTQMPYKEVAGSSYNLLLAPWPFQVEASDITPADHLSAQERFGYFKYSPRNGYKIGRFADWLNGLLRRAKEIGQAVDMIVFPECALDEKEWSTAKRIGNSFGAAIIAGVRGPGKKRGENSVRFKAPFSWHSEAIQHKHHRWQIEEGQISNYCLGGTLDRRKAWWENIDIRPRTLNFFAIRPEMVICPLICEDLARQEPVTDLVRSVGPNLVIALLMDGPQLADRWSARYATVLADDPGSSVLTISSLGMVKLSRPRGVAPSKIFASWKDAFGSFVPLELCGNESGLVLNLQFRLTEECTVDGRTDSGVATTPVLCGIHPLELGGLT